MSIILNLHDEVRFVDRTLASLQEAVSYAVIEGTRFELVVVADRPTPSLSKKVDEIAMPGFERVLIIRTDFGSLSLARNAGVAATRGRYITVADGDDLVSFNLYVECLRQLAVNENAIVVPEFIYAFGASYHLWQYFGQDRISPLSFFGFHPYISRVFARRELFERFPYIDFPRGGAFLYEDWHFNKQAIHAGYEFVVAPRTLLFYRQRTGSIMATVGRNGTTAYSPYFSRSSFLEKMKPAYERYRASSHFNRADSESIRRYAAGSQVMLELLHAANKIDASIDHEHVRSMACGSNLSYHHEESTRLGAAYYEILQSLDSEDYRDVFLLPFLSRGGAEKFMLQIMHAMNSLDTTRRILILTGERFEEHAGTDRLPERVTFVDVAKIADRHHVTNLNPLLLRVIQACAPHAKLHTNGAGFTHHFLTTFGGALPKNRLVYYLFGEEVITRDLIPFRYGANLNFLSEALRPGALIVSDHEAILAEARHRLYLEGVSLRTLYAEVQIPQQTHRCSVERNGSIRLIWASRMDAQKRPDLVHRIVRRAQERGLPVFVDMYGGSVFGYRMSASDKLDSVRYVRPFAGFADLPINDYDAFLYTSAFDGLPNVVLEALASGMPVIAPAVGGIPEVITEETGMLVENHPDDQVLIENYVDAIEELFSEPSKIAARSLRARELLAIRHSGAAHRRAVVSIFLSDDEDACRVTHHE